MTSPTTLLRASAAATLLTLVACKHPSFPNHPEGYREFAYVANTAGNSVTVLDLVYLRPDRTLQVGASPVAVAVNPRRQEVYALNAYPGESAGSVSVIDTSSNAVVATIPVEREPSSIAVDSTGQRAYVANSGSGSVSVLDLDLRRQIATYAAGAHPASVAVAPDGRTVLVTGRASGSIDLYTPGIPPLTNKNTSDPKVGYGAPLAHRAAFHDCSGASASVILPDSSKAFIACTKSNQVLALSLAAASDSWPARQDAGLLTDHALALLDVGQKPSSLALKPDGGEVFVSNSGSDSISEISTTNNEVGSTYAIGNRPAQGVVSPDNSALWVANAGADSISLYSIDDGKFLSSIHTGDSPAALAFSTDGHLLLVADSRSGDVALVRISSNLGPGLFTMLPAGGNPSAIVVKSNGANP